MARYRHVAEALHAVLLSSAVKITSGLSDTAQQLIRDIHHLAGDHGPWRRC